jgi:LmbE family N-acetylglucosaminyl deacetylase
MLSVKFADKSGGLKILCLGAHCDDIEIGCGATIMRLVKEHAVQHLKWFVFTSSGERAVEATNSAAHFLQGCKESEIVIKKFKDGFLPYEALHLKNLFEEIKPFNPDIIFTHYRHDLHQDHRTVCELTWNTFRNHLIFEYEIPKYDGDLGSPNYYVTINEDGAREKVDVITNCFRSQAGKQWFDKETFFSLMRIRGIESASPSKYAEGFYVRKSVV